MNGLPRPLPSMMQYTDNHLMKNRHLYGRPPNPDTRCPIELSHGNTRRLFLPLSPCGHWIHYECFVWWITRIHLNQDRCPACYIRVFDWDGISALTIATRSNIEMEDSPIRAPYNDSVTGKSIFTDSQQYAAECETFEKMIADHFYDHYTKSGQLYVGVNLTSVYREVMEEIRILGMPRSRGLHWTGICGYLLFGMLVLIKLERWVKETNAGYLATQGWETFLQGKEGMRMDIRRAIDGP
ncbi:hypothetical protein BCR34DRAFT_494569 [Clohesyomyces aquaticus]|uniref:RING-type domain-containing protein n=1 Tax=Clohesyomyces aquaticus TaxID=1231657 RepID=A0A1Y1YRK1_9PLEO|nr:hypothetical protein BCR34DRAFT_494569 [Clohesyomyces aquaticus]